MKRPIDIVRKIAPKVRSEYAAAFDAGDAKLAAAGITTPLRLAHLLGQIGAECSFTAVRESMHYTKEDRLIEIFNKIKHTTALLPGESKLLLGQDEDIGERFFGIGGPSPLYASKNFNNGTNPGNPKKAKSLGNTRPGDGFRFRGNGMLQTTGGDAHRRIGDKVGVDFFDHPELLTSPEHALEPVLFEWTNSKCNTFADADDVLSISKAINIGDPNSPATPIGMDDRITWLKRAKNALGIP
jgi:putative chitinase